MISSAGSGTLNVQRDRLIIATVKKGSFADNIPIIGNVEPLNSIFVTANEGGNVEEIFVDDGAMVGKGAPLMRLAYS